ncbi:hypothetical protein Q7C36_014501 [Tachysurus vachellii]|uniref:Uncharacterized protein n=1 Tax=Tachysurus vachellii TaxID=175792 RepID=A0AA88MEQ9_TACVA|nr:hypothetical protein Q7C36_014501 [Tachysurus vachellii]
MTHAVLSIVLEEERKDKTSASEGKRHWRRSRCQNQESGSGRMLCVRIVGVDLRAAAPVNTFLLQAIHRYTLAAETSLMNFNLLSVEGPHVPALANQAQGGGRGHTDRLTPELRP